MSEHKWSKLCIVLVVVSAIFLLALWSHLTTTAGSIRIESTLSKLKGDVERNRSNVKGNKSFLLWSNDYHISPIRDFRTLVKPLGVNVIDYNFHEPFCRTFTNSCANEKMKAILKDPLFLRQDIMNKFHEAYKQDAEMLSVDAFICFHPISICELFIPFNRTVIVIASIRYELGRHDKKAWIKLNNNLRLFAARPGGIVGANNLYDAEYIKYFTGIKAVVLPSYSDYHNTTYTQSRPGFLLVTHLRPKEKHQNFTKQLWADFRQECTKTNCTVQMWDLRQKYEWNYKYSDIAAHWAAVHIPYQVSTMSIFEQYRMNIPLFFPTLDLLTDWQFRHRVVSERSWHGVFNWLQFKNQSLLPPHRSQRHVPDPNSDHDRKGIRYWLKFSDFYQWPYIRYFDSIANLTRQLQKVTSAELHKTSSLMREYNVKLKQRLLSNWTNILTTISHYSPHRAALKPIGGA